MDKRVSEYFEFFFKLGHLRPIRGKDLRALFSADGVAQVLERGKGFLGCCSCILEIIFKIGGTKGFVGTAKSKISQSMETIKLEAAVTVMETFSAKLQRDRRRLRGLRSEVYELTLESAVALRRKVR